jgi:predicted nucleic acid-binding protein
MSIVSNASPLITLARIGSVSLLQQLYTEVIIPEAVWHEVVVEGADYPGAKTVSDASWITRRAVTNRPLVQALRQELDAGEAEAIALALELGASLLLMDERLGRETARHLGVRYTGVLGILMEAKQKRLLQALKPSLDALRDVAGFRVSEALYLRVLRDAGET